MLIVPPLAGLHLVLEHGYFSHKLAEARALVFFNELLVEFIGPGEVGVHDDGIVQFFEVLKLFQ
jgi:hypothetical protein